MEKWQIRTFCIFRVKFKFTYYVNGFILQQTNTADMLDEAVAYVKSLQKQIEVFLVCICAFLFTCVPAISVVSCDAFIMY